MGFVDVEMVTNTTFTLSSVAGGVTTSATVTVRVFADLATWRRTHFGVAVDDPSQEATLWGDLVDDDGDGLVNLVEYALGSDPRNASPEAVPEARIIRLEGQNRAFQIGFRGLIRVGALRYVAEWSTNLRDWNPLDTSTWQEEVVASGDSEVPNWHRFNAPEAVGSYPEPRRYLRLALLNPGVVED